LPVTVTDLTFQGAAVRVALRSAAGSSSLPKWAAANRPTGLVPGATLWATWDIDAARALVAEERE
jgi:hypothetical protein